MLRRQAERLALLPLALPPPELSRLFDVVVVIALVARHVTLPPIASCSMLPELSSLTVKSPPTRAGVDVARAVGVHVDAALHVFDADAARAVLLDLARCRRPSRSRCRPSCRASRRRRRARRRPRCRPSCRAARTLPALSISMSPELSPTSARPAMRSTSRSPELSCSVRALRSSKAASPLESMASTGNARRQRDAECRCRRSRCCPMTSSSSFCGSAVSTYTTLPSRRTLICVASSSSCLPAQATPRASMRTALRAADHLHVAGARRACTTFSTPLASTPPARSARNLQSSPQANGGRGAQGEQDQPDSRTHVSFSQNARRLCH